MHKAVRRLRNREGFTLIELLVVLAIIGILAAIAIPAYMGYMKAAKQRAVAENFDAAMRYVKAEMAKNSFSPTSVTTDAAVSMNSGQKMSPWVTNDDAFTTGTGTGAATNGQVVIEGSADKDNVKAACADGNAIVISADTGNSASGQLGVTLNCSQL